MARHPGLNAYQQNIQRTELPKSLEQRQIYELNSRLVRGIENGGRDLIEACFFTRKLWIIFTVALTDPDHPYEEDLRIVLLTTGKAAMDTVNRVMSRSMTPEVERTEIEALITIHRQLADLLGGAPIANPEEVQEAVPVS